MRFHQDERTQITLVKTWEDCVMLEEIDRMGSPEYNK